ncbi:MAG: ATP-binding protein [Luteimonas sp.]
MRTLIVLLSLLCGLAGPAAARVLETPRLRVLGIDDGMPSSYVTALAQDRAGYLWIATQDGLARYDGIGFKVWQHAPDDPQSLPGNFLQALYIDGADRVWTAAESGGLSVLDAQRNHFRTYRRSTNPEIGSDDVFSIVGRGEDLWFGTFGGGLHRMDAQSHIVRFVHDEHDARSLPSDDIMSLAFDAHGALWIATTAGLARWTMHGIERVALPGDEPAPMLYSVATDGDTVWVGARNGVFIRRADGRWTVPTWSGQFEYPNAMMSMARDPDGRFWITGQRMLARAAPDADAHMVTLDPRAVAAVRPVHTVLVQNNGAVWVPVPGKGLGYLRSDWRRIASLSKSDDGLAGDLYRGIATSARGGFWLTGTTTGVVEHLDPRSGAVEHFAARAFEGLKGTAIVEDRDRRLWIGHRAGLMRFDPSTGALQQWTADSVADATLDGPINLLRVAADGSLWLSSLSGGLQHRDAISGRVMESVVPADGKGLESTDVDFIEFGPDGALWVAGEQGLLRRDPRTGIFTAAAGIGSERVHAFAFDGPERLWVHRLSGLEGYRPQDGRWRRDIRYSVRDGVAAVEASGMRVDAGHRVWVATTRGLLRIDPATRRVRVFGVRDGLDNQEFNDRAIALSPDGTLGLSTMDGSVVLVDTALGDTPSSHPHLLIDSVGVLRQGKRQMLGRGFELRPDDRELRIGARLLAYDDPQANRYWSKLEGFDHDWVAQQSSGERVFTGLPSGGYTFHVRAADSTGNLAPEKTLQFRVLPPWWRAPWALALAAVLVLILLWWLGRSYQQRLQRRHAWQLAKDKQELAEHASQAKTHFLATLGHEVRTPMTGVLGMSELLLDTDLDTAQRSYAESIRIAGNHLMRLVNDALDLARIEAGRLELDVQPFDLGALVEDVGDLMAPIARQHGLEFRMRTTADAPFWLLGDAVRVRQILLNLLGNAIKFTERGHVALRVESSPGGGVRFIVSDTGPGVDEEQKQRLFRRFEQAEGVRTASRYGGSGLGLAICQELAAAMSGRIAVDSALGQGASFIVDLPLANAEPEPMQRSVHVRDRSRALRLLLVEDDPTVAEVIAGLLRAQGHHVAHATQGLAALMEIAQTRFDAALLDLDLPGIDGLALARELRAQGFDQPLIAVTARADADAEPLSRAAGFDGFLRKPLTGDMLAESIEAVVPTKIAMIIAD